MKPTKKNIVVLCCSIALICAVTFGAGWIKNFETSALRIAANVILNLLNGLIAVVAMKATGMKSDIDIKSKRQYLIGIALALCLSVVIAIIPALCGFSLVGSHRDFSWSVLIHDLLFCLLIVGPVEELVFRVYLQDAFVSFFARRKWLGVILAAFLFGLWHIINGSVVQVLFTFGIGLVFGFAKHATKGCSYVSVAFGHGIYDFLNTLVRMFIA